ncbi:NUDIX hydrolase domain-like protein [Xylariales sp. PMI_506]|nr:NUDIX hydrolase domain-like protein [Xylariales sp. PMI_506]
MAPDQPRVQVGVGVFVLASKDEPRDNPRFLVGKRKNAHGAGTWALPGGHLEFGEEPEECAARELLEETGLRVSVDDAPPPPHGPRFFTAVNSCMPADGKHYVTLFMVCERADDNADEPRVMEPDKCEGWEWVTWADLMGWIERELAVGRGEIEAQSLERRVFEPLVNLVRQRPGLVPTNP